MSDRYISATRESKSLEFKRSFDSSSAGDWCELLKDIVAMANSGGGRILIGVDDDGTTVGGDCVKVILRLDAAKITDKVAAYTGVHFSDFRVLDVTRDGAEVAVLEIYASQQPILFERVGNYVADGGRQKTAFQPGTLYVRHGAKSEPATNTDLAAMVERHVRRVRKELLSGVRRMVSAPLGSLITVESRPGRHSAEPSALPVRLTDDPRAPELRLFNPDEIYPHRQRDLIAAINAKAGKEHQVNQYHIRAVRSVHDTDSDPRFYFKLKQSAPQYSEAFLDWLLEQFARDPRFFEKACTAFKASMQGRNAAYGP